MCCGMLKLMLKGPMFERICLCIFASFSIDRSGSPSARLRTMAELVHWSISGNRDDSAQTLPQEPYPIRSSGLVDWEIMISSIVRNRICRRCIGVAMMVGLLRNWVFLGTKILCWQKLFMWNGSTDFGQAGGRIPRGRRLHHHWGCALQLHLPRLCTSAQGFLGGHSSPSLSVVKVSLCLGSS